MEPTPPEPAAAELTTAELTTAELTTAELTTAGLTAALCRWIDRLWPDAARGELVAGELRDAFGRDGSPIDAESCAAVQAVANRRSRHLELAFEPGAVAEPDSSAPGWPPPDPVAVASRAAAVSAVERRPDGIAVIRLDDLDPVQLAAPYLEAAFALTRGAAGLVLDLRRNGGGDPGTIAMVLDRVSGGPPRRFADVVYRDRVRQWWTPGLAGASARPPGTPLGVLVSSRTYSSGEALAYHLQQQFGAVVVGETTRGAADHITPVRVVRQVVAYLPEAYVVDASTGTNWEGRGVVPDVACQAGEAEEVAARRLRGPGKG
jgi:hypothetical protein